MSKVLTAIQLIFFFLIFKGRYEFPFQPGIQSTSSVQKLVLLFKVSVGSLDCIILKKIYSTG